MELFINGVSVGTDNPGGGDWTGGDAAGVGTRGAANTGGIGGGQQATESFDGQIAIFRVYRNQLLNESQVADNFDAVVKESGADSDVDKSDRMYVESIDTTNTQGVVTISLPQVIGEVGNFTTNGLDNLTSVTQSLNNTFVNPVVLVTPPTERGGDASVVRILDIDPNSFEAILVEAPNHGGGHTAETVDYTVWEEGQYTLTDGTKVMVGTVDATGNAWQTVNFGGFFDSAPAIVTQIQSLNDATNTFVKTRQQNTTAAGFQVKLERAEGESPHGTETIGFVAIERSSGVTGDLLYDVDTTGAFIDDTYDAVL